MCNSRLKGQIISNYDILCTSENQNPCPWLSGENPMETGDRSAEQPGFSVRCISARAFEGFFTEHKVRVQITSADLQLSLWQANMAHFHRYINDKSPFSSIFNSYFNLFYMSRAYKHYPLVIKHGLLENVPLAKDLMMSPYFNAPC